MCPSKGVFQWSRHATVPALGVAFVQGPDRSTTKEQTAARNNAIGTLKGQVFNTRVVNVLKASTRRNVVFSAITRGTRGQPPTDPFFEAAASQVGSLVVGTLRCQKPYGYFFEVDVQSSVVEAAWPQAGRATIVSLLPVRELSWDTSEPLPEWSVGEQVCLPTSTVKPPLPSPPTFMFDWAIMIAMYSVLTWLRTPGLQVPLTIHGVHDNKTKVGLSYMRRFDDADHMQELEGANKMTSQDGAPALDDLPPAISLVVRRLATVEAILHVELESLTTDPDAEPSDDVQVRAPRLIHQQMQSSCVPLCRGRYAWCCRGRVTTCRLCRCF